jgi:hypothetical protein
MMSSGRERQGDLMTDDTIRVRAEAVASQEIDGETVLLDLKSSEYLGVNESGTLLWQALLVGTTRRDLVALLCERFGIQQEQADADVDAFLADCDDRGLLDKP